ncbi:MAG: hypothetical protein QXZ44_02960 [Ferroplasma sp.]
MKIIAEIYPTKKLENLREHVKYMDGFDGFNIPDNPLGYPTMPPDIIACTVRSVFPNKEIIMNQRLKDITELKLRSEIQAAKSLNASMIFTQGDKPVFGNEINDMPSEYALSIAKKRKLSSGLILSFNHSLEEIKERMKQNADIFLVVNMDNTTILDRIEADRLLPYIIIESEKNRDIINKIHQSSIPLANLKEYIQKIKKYNIYGVLISVPGDIKTMDNIFDYM